MASDEKNESIPSRTDESIPEVLAGLLSAEGITAEMLAKSVRLHPELLGEAAQSYLDFLAQAQDAPEAQETVRDLARVLNRLRTESMEAVASSEASRSRRHNSRRAREKRLQTARERFFEWRRSPAKGAAEPSPRPLPSLAEVVTHLRSISASERAQPYGRDILNPQAGDDAIPDFLFRGESGLYKNTRSSMARLNASPRALEDIGRIRDQLIDAFSEKFGLTAPQAFGYLQHYGFPTDYIDVTSDASVATSFASSLRVGQAGAICIVPTQRLVARGNLIDLRSHPLALRPRLQSAFAMNVPEHSDLKAPATIEDLQLTWVEFRLTDLDAARFAPDFALLDAHADRVAGLIWLLINDCSKFSDEAASLLSRRLDPAPVFGLADRDGKVILVSADEVPPGEAISDEDFRRFEYESWSNAFVAPVRQPLPPELENALGTAADLKPGSVIRLLTTRCFGKRKSS